MVVADIIVLPPVIIKGIIEEDFYYENS